MPSSARAAAAESNTASRRTDPIAGGPPGPDGMPAAETPVKRCILTDMDVRLEPVEPGDFRAVHALLSDAAVAPSLGATPADRVDEWRVRLAEADPERCFRLKALTGGRLAGIVSLEIERGLR